MRQTLSNRAVNFLNIHFGLQTFSNGLGDIFFGIYLYKVGVPLFAIYLVLTGIFLFRLCIRPLALKLVFKRGLKKSVLLGTFIHSTLYLFLGMVDGINIWLYIFIVAAAIIDVLYWLPYHTYFSLLGDLEHRGKQTAMRDGIVHVASFLAPITGGILINFVGFWAAFITATVLMLFAAIPLRYTPEVPLEDHLTAAEASKKVSKAGMYCYIGEGFHYFAHLFTWPIVLFLMLDDYISFGGLLSLAVLFQIIGSLWVGHLFDSGNGKRIYPIGFILIILTILGRTFFAMDIPTVIFFDILAMMGYLLSQGIVDSAFYNTSKKSHHPLWFQFYAENGWDIGSSASALLVAGMLYSGMDLRYVMLVGLLGLVVTGGFLRWYFRDRS